MTWPAEWGRRPVQPRLAASLALLLVALLAAGEIARSAGLFGAGAMLVVWAVVRVARRQPLLWMWTEPMFGIDDHQVVHIIDSRLDVRAKLRNLGPHGARDLYCVACSSPRQ